MEHNRQHSRCEQCILFIASGCGSGFFPWAPGTIGSAVAIIVLAVLTLSLGELSLISKTALVIVSSGIGWWSCERTLAIAPTHNSRKLNDPGFVVIDEWAGIFVTFLFVPLTPLTALMGFAFFRLFDILKPGPVGWAEKLPGGLGIMSDDLIAGGFASALLFGAHSLFLQLL